MEDAHTGKRHMRTITLEELLEAGCHFGHQVTRQNPKARDFVFEARDGVHIIDLAKTKEGLEEAAAYVKNLAKDGGNMVILGAKRQAAPIVAAEVKRAQDAGASGLYSVTARWIGGLLTNFSEVTKNFKRLHTLTELLVDKTQKARYTKKELSLFDKEKTKLEKFYGGVASMTAIPSAVFIIDTHLEDLAVREALNVNIPIVGITDTNADPTEITYAIPANDDAAGSLELIIKYIVDAWIEGSEAGKKAQAKAAEVKPESPSATSGQEKGVEKPVAKKNPSTSSESTKTPVKKVEKKETSK
jgi:small subunit ribosomal protein S2